MMILKIHLKLAKLLSKFDEGVLSIEETNRVVSKIKSILYDEYRNDVSEEGFEKYGHIYYNTESGLLKRFVKDEHKKGGKLR